MLLWLRQSVTGDAFEEIDRSLPAHFFESAHRLPQLSFEVYHFPVFFLFRLFTFEGDDPGLGTVIGNGMGWNEHPHPRRPPNPQKSLINPCFQRWWAELDSNQRRRKPADLQSAPFGHFGIYPFLVRLRGGGGYTCSALSRKGFQKICHHFFAGFGASDAGAGGGGSWERSMIFTERISMRSPG